MGNSETNRENVTHKVNFLGRNKMSQRRETNNCKCHIVTLHNVTTKKFEFSLHTVRSHTYTCG